MGVAELAAAFNEVAAPRYSCSRAFSRYARNKVDEKTHEVQILAFSGRGADGVGFSVESEPIPANGDVIEAARATARRLLEKGEPES